MKDAGILASGLAAIMLLSFFCVRTHATAIEEDLFRRASEALRSNGIRPDGMSVSGRDATLTGPSGSPIVSQKARQVVAEVSGVRMVEVKYLPAAAIPAETEATQTASSGTDAGKAQREIGAILSKETIGFGDSSADLTPNGKKVLDRLISVLAAYPDLKIEIQGYTDSRGNAGWNLDLSRRRAGSVQAYLISKGIDSRRLTATGFGPARPVASNDTPEGQQRNRRIEFKVSGGR